MADPLRLSIDNTSPTISYYPFADTFGAPNLNAGWNPYFSDSGYAAFQGQLGSGTSAHRTSLDGASFSVQWNGAYRFPQLRSTSNIATQELAFSSLAIPLKHRTT